MVDRRLLLLVLLPFVGMVASGASAGELDSYNQALWRLEHEFVEWADLEETGRRKGVPVATRGQSQEDFLARLKSLEGDIKSADSGIALGLERKVDVIRSRIVEWPGPLRGAREGTRVARFPTGGEPANVRAILPSADCSDAIPLSSETLYWATTDPRTGPGEALVAWFAVTDLPTGWYRIDTEGSAVDTVLTVFGGCGGEILGTNDDAVGLQSRLVVRKDPESAMVVKVEVMAYEGQQGLYVTLRGAGSGAITGTVRDESTGEPIDDVRVELFDGLGSYEGSDWTSASGQFLIDGLEPGDYFVLTEGTDDYLDELWNDNPCEFSCDPLNGDSVAVDQDTVSGIDFHLSPGASISGTIRDAAGGLVTSGSVDLSDQYGDRVSYQYLDNLGRYEFRGLLGGTYFLSMELDEYLNELWDDIPCASDCDPLLGTPIALEDLQRATGFDFQLERLGTISGSLTESQTGLPIAYGHVRLERFDGNDSDTAHTDNLGRWTSDGLLPGVYFVNSDLYGQYQNEVYDDIPCTPDCTPSQGTGISLDLEQDVVGIDLALDRLGGISGRVLDRSTESPIAEVRVEAWDDTGRLVESGYSSTLGIYELTGLSPGTYFVVTDEDGPFIDELFENLPCYRGPPEGCDPQVGTPVSIKLGELRGGVDLKLALGGILAGRVLDKATGEPALDSDPMIFGSSGERFYIGYATPRGEFMVDGLPPDSYYVMTDSETHLDQLWENFDCEGGCDPLAGTPIQLDLGLAVRDIDFDLVLQGGISGTVTDERSMPVQGVLIHAWDSLGGAVAASATDAGGFFQIDLSSGFFYLSTQAPDGYADMLWTSLPCPDGPAIEGLCDPLHGDRITLVGADPVQAGFDFVLAQKVFFDGFESGDLSGWSDSMD